MATHTTPKYGSKELPPASRVVSALDVELETGRLQSHDDQAGQLKVQFSFISMAALCYVSSIYTSASFEASADLLARRSPLPSPLLGLPPFDPSLR